MANWWWWIPKPHSSSALLIRSLNKTAFDSFQVTQIASKILAPSSQLFSFRVGPDQLSLHAAFSAFSTTQCCVTLRQDSRQLSATLERLRWYEVQSQSTQMKEPLLTDLRSHSSLTLSAVIYGISARQCRKRTIGGCSSPAVRLFVSPPLPR